MPSKKEQLLNSAVKPKPGLDLRIGWFAIVLKFCLIYGAQQRKRLIKSRGHQ